MNYDDYIDPFEESKEKEKLEESLNEELRAKEILTESLEEEQNLKEEYISETEEKSDKIKKLYQVIKGLVILFLIAVLYISFRSYQSRKQKKLEAVPRIQNPNYFNNGHFN